MKNKRFLLKLCLSLLILVLLFQYLDLRRAYLIIKDMQIWYLVVVFLIINADRVFMAYKWKILLNAKKLKSPLSSLVFGYYFSLILDPILPTTVGADVVRGISVGKDKIGSDNIFSSIVIERILGMLSLFLLVLLTFGYFVFIRFDYLFNLIVYSSLLLVLSVILFYYSMEKKYFNIKSNIKILNFSSGTLSYLDRVYSSYLEYKNYRKQLVSFFFLSMVEHIMVVFLNYLIIKSLGLNVSLISAVFTIPAIMFFSRIPISIGQIGVQEGAYVLVLSMIGLTLTDSVTISVVMRGMVFLSLLPVFLIGLVFRKGTVLKISSSSMNEQAEIK